jgi:hypothetical protein
MEMRSVRNLPHLVTGCLNCGEQLQVSTAKPFCVFQNLNKEILFPYQFKLANGSTTILSSHFLNANFEI